jgi:hypothetical protein
MNATIAKSRDERATVLRVFLVIFGGTILMLGCCAWAVTGFFRLSSGTAVLRDSVLREASGEWNRKISVNVGGFTTGLVRAGLSFVKMEPEARAAINSLRGGDVAIYTRTGEGKEFDCGAALTRADKKMKARGWTRIVAVKDKKDFVIVYVPAGKIAPDKVTCCVLVYDGRQMVVASVRGNLEAVQSILEQHLKEGLDRHGLFSED